EDPRRTASQSVGMSLTVGTGPFGKRPAGTFNTPIEPPGALLFWDPVPHRVRAIFAGETLVDSTNVKMLHQTGHLPVYYFPEVVADSRRARILFEAALPARYYFPEEDVRTELLEASSKKTRCAYKGSASYWHVRVADELHEDLVWTYREPQHDAEPVRDLLAFFNERVDLEIEGELAERPTTQWSRTDR